MYIQRKKPKILIFESAVLYQRKTRIMSLYRAKYVHSTGCCRKNVLLSKSTASPRCALIMACMRSILYTRLRLAGLFPKTDAGQGIRKMLNFFKGKGIFSGTPCTYMWKLVNKSLRRVSYTNPKFLVLMAITSFAFRICLLKNKHGPDQYLRKQKSY